MQKTLTQKQLGHALFYSIKMNDFQHAQYLLSIDAPVNTSFFIEQDTVMYTTNMLVGKVAESLKKYGLSHAKSQLLLRIFDKFIDAKCDLRCHCSNKNPHYCPMSQAFKFIQINTQQDLLIQQNLLILKLLYHGGTYKNINNEKNLRQSGLKILSSYLQTRKDQVIELVKMNRHANKSNKINNNVPINRHAKCPIN